MIAGRAIAVALLLACVASACSSNPAGEIPDLEQRLDAAARASDGNVMALGDAVRTRWDRAVIVSCGDEAATRAALGFDWSGIPYIHSIDGLCDFEREVDAVLFVDADSIRGWGTVNRKVDDTYLSIEVLLPASMTRESAIFSVALDHTCTRECPTYRLQHH
jgi:hypothetical protein